MNDWIDVPDLKPGDRVIVSYIGTVTIHRTEKQHTGDYLVLYWITPNKLDGKIFLSATSLQVAEITQWRGPGHDPSGNEY